MNSDATICQQNDPASRQWSEQSFVGRLTEEGVFDADRYRELEAVIRRITEAEPSAAVIWLLFRIFERVTLLLGCHLDPADMFSIQGMDDGAVADFNSRFRRLFVELSARPGNDQPTAPQP